MSIWLVVKEKARKAHHLSQRGEKYQTAAELRLKYREIIQIVHLNERLGDLKLIALFEKNIPGSGSLWYRRHSQASYCYGYRSERLLSEYYYLARLTDESGAYGWQESDMRRVVDGYDKWIMAQRNPGAFGIRGLRCRANRNIKDVHEDTPGSKLAFMYKK